MSSFAKGLALLLSSLTATAPAAAQVQPSFSDKGVEANAYGAERHYPMPPPDRPFDQSTIIGWHSHYDHIASKLDTVAKAAAPSPLEYGKAEIASAEIHDYLDHNPVTSFAVARDNTILSEHYLYARTDKNRFLSNSMAKSITGLLVGIALSDGAIRSLDDTAQTYVPELTGTEYGITPIRALLRMASSVQFGETYQPGSDILKLQAALLWPGAVGAPRALKPFNTRLVPPSTCSMSQRSPPATTIFAAARQATGISCGCCQAAGGRSRWPAGSGNGCSSILPRTSSWRKPPSR